MTSMCGVLGRAGNMLIGPLDRISRALLLLSLCSAVRTVLNEV